MKVKAKCPRCGSALYDRGQGHYTCEAHHIFSRYELTELYRIRERDLSPEIPDRKRKG